MFTSHPKKGSPKSCGLEAALAALCVFSLVALCPGACAAQAADGGGKELAPAPEAGEAKAVPTPIGPDLELLEARIDPVGKGKNILNLSVRNLSMAKQLFAVHIQTRSPNIGAQGLGWGTTFFEEIAPQETATWHVAFKIHADVVDSTFVRLRFYNPTSRDNRDSEGYLAESKYTGAQLQRRKPATAEAAPAELKDVLTARLTQLQLLLAAEEYDKVWASFTRDYRQAEWHENYESFANTMREKRPVFWWSRADFLNLQPQDAATRGDAAVLTAKQKDETWTLDFVRDGAEWKLDWLDGYLMPVAAWSNWMERLLPKMEKRATEHFDIYYFKSSTAERDIDAIAEEREKVFKEVFDFFATPPHGRARLIFFEDKETKHAETGHQGAGWAFDNNMVEVYSDAEKVDPAHELTHVIAGGFGEPPAMLSEGLGVYMEKGHTWHGVSVDATTEGLVRDGRFVPIIELLKRTEIGARHDDGEVAYPESGCFVKYVVDTYGREKFIELYRRLRNGDSDETLLANARAMKNVLGKDVNSIEEDWKKALASGKTQSQGGVK